MAVMETPNTRHPGIFYEGDIVRFRKEFGYVLKILPSEEGEYEKMIVVFPGTGMYSEEDTPNRGQLELFRNGSLLGGDDGPIIELEETAGPTLKQICMEKNRKVFDVEFRLKNGIKNTQNLGENGT